MKKLFLFLIPAFFLFSCKKEKSSTHATEITVTGSKWGIKIGSTYAETYAQLQASGAQNQVSQVDIIDQKQVFDKPEEIQQRLKFYRMIVLEKAGSTGQTAIFYDNEVVTQLVVPGPALANKWPQNASDDNAILQGERAENIYNKLVAILKQPDFAGYKITLADKSLEKAYDPDMANYKEWAFYISKNVNAGVSGRYYIRLMFSNGKLNMIRTEYNESDIYY